MAGKTNKEAAKCDNCCSKLQKRISAVGATLIVTLIVAALGAVFGLWAFVETANNTSEVNRLSSDISRINSEAAKDDVKANGVSYEGKNDKTALELLKDSHKVETKEFSGMGEFVTAIDGVEAEDGKNFWAFYVNGEMAAEGAGTYKTKDGEKIEWRLDAIQ